MRTFWLLTIMLSSLLAEDIGRVDVTEEATEPTQTFSSVYEEPEYLQTPNYIEKAPGQKRLTAEEAMFIPGVQGDPVKALKTVGGVTSMGDTSGELYIYGSKPEESVTTLNHLPIGYLFHLFGIHSVIAPDAMEQIDAYLGGYDVTYGNAMGGVIDVTPKYPEPKNSAMGHMGIYDASASMNVALNDEWSFYLGARRSYFDLFLDAVGKTTGTLSEDDNVTYTQFPNYYDITAYLTYRPDGKNLFSLESINADDRLEIATYANAEKDPLATGNIDSQRGFNSVGLRWQYEGLDYQANTLAYHMNSRTKSRFYENFYVDIETQLSGVFHQSTYRYGAHRIVAGGEYQHSFTPLELNVSDVGGPEDIDFDFTTADKYYIRKNVTANNLSLFLEDIYSVSDALTLRYGVRYGYSDYLNLGSHIDPRLSAVYALDGVSNVSFSTGLYTQHPPGYKTVEKLGNEALKSERAWHYILHYDRSFANGTTLSIEPYYKRFEALAIEDNATQYANEGEGYAYGVDVSAKVRKGDLYGFLAYTYLRSEREINAQYDELYRFYGEVPHTLQLLGGMRFWKTWSFSTLMKYHSGKPYTAIVGTYVDGTGRTRPLYGEPFGERLEDYFTLNLKIAQQRRVTGGELEWSFELMNVTNHGNVSGIRYDENYNKVGYYEELPFLPWIDITYRF